VHFEAARSLRDVAVAQLEHPLDVLPAHAIGRHRILGRFRGCVLLGKEGAFDRIGVGRLWQIVDRPRLYRRDRGRDIAVTGQHHDPGSRTGLAQRTDDIEPAPVAEPHVDDGESRRLLGRRGDPAGDTIRGGHEKAPPLHRPGEPLAQRCVVVDDQQGAFGFGQPL
jgi:hypothetical protein